MSALGFSTDPPLFFCQIVEARDLGPWQIGHSEGPRQTQEADYDANERANARWRKE